MLTLCQMKPINQNHFHKDSLEKMLSWKDRFKQLGLTASNGFSKREIFCILICMLQSCQRWEG